MTRTSVLSLRPAIALALVVAAVALLLLASQQQAEAGGANSLAISPATRDVGVGGSTTVDLVSMAPTESLAAWVIDVEYDPTVVSFASCDSIDNPPGAVAVSDCDSADKSGGPEDETVVSVGGILFPSTERGLDGTNTLATIEFDAVGEVDDCTDLTITVIDHLGPDPQADSTNPTVTNGEICITAGVTRIWGDFDCSGALDPIDALKLLRSDAALSVSQAQDCPAPSAMVTVDGTPRVWGDLDCSGTADPIDALKTLRKDAGLTVNQSAGCPEPGAEVSVN